MAEITIFDASGSAVAYIAADSEGTIYLWSGDAVAFLHGEHVYGFNGQHLGWFDSGIVRDGKGCAVGFTKEACPKVTKVEPVKRVKKVKRVKSVRRVAPVRLVNKLATSSLPLAIFLQSGAR
jgi:hypothetical protein